MVSNITNLILWQNGFNEGFHMEPGVHGTKYSTKLVPAEYKMMTDYVTKTLLHPAIQLGT